MTSGTTRPGAAKAAPGPLIAAAVLLLAGIGLFTQAVRAARDNGVTVGGPTAAPLIVTGIWVLVASSYLVGRLRTREAAPAVRWHTPGLLLAALIGYAVALKYTVAGYALATSLFILISARLLSTRPLREVIVRDLCVAIGLSLGIYLAFTRLLGIVLPAGVLPL